MAIESDILHRKIDPVVTVLSGISAVKGVLCFGSYAQGNFDEQSDIDLFVLCDKEIVSEEERRRVFEAIDGVEELQINRQDPVWSSQWSPVEDRFCLNGVLIDIGWNTIDWIRTVIQKVAKEGLISFPELRFRAHTTLGLLENSIILLDSNGEIRRMKSEIYPYPQRLKQALLRENLPSLRESVSEMRNYIERGIGNSAVLFRFGRFLDALGAILFALNERYDPATKRIEEVYATMSKLPKDFVNRYNRIFEIPLTEKGRRELVGEIEALEKEIEIMIEDADK